MEVYLELIVEDLKKDGLENMKENEFSWLYLRDETQDLARACGALRTSKFYVVDEN